MAYKERKAKAQGAENGPREAAIRMYRIEKIGAPRIASALGVHFSTVYEWLDSADIPRRTLTEAHGITDGLVTNWARQYRDGKGLSLRQIALATGRSEHTIARHLNRSGFKTSLTARAQPKRQTVEEFAREHGRWPVRADGAVHRWFLSALRDRRWLSSATKRLGVVSFSEHRATEKWHEYDEFCRKNKRRPRQRTTGREGSLHNFERGQLKTGSRKRLQVIWKKWGVLSLKAAAFEAQRAELNAFARKHGRAPKVGESARLYHFANRLRRLQPKLFKLTVGAIP